MTAKYTECLCTCRTSESKTKNKIFILVELLHMHNKYTNSHSHAQSIQLTLQFYINSHNCNHSFFSVISNAHTLHHLRQCDPDAIFFFFVIQFHSFSTLFCRQKIFRKIIPPHFHVVVKYRTKYYCTLNHIRIFIWAQNICNLI